MSLCRSVLLVVSASITSAIAFHLSRNSPNTNFMCSFNFFSGIPQPVSIVSLQRYETRWPITLLRVPAL